MNMQVKDAVAKRFEQLCREYHIRPNELAVRAGVTPSTVYSMLDPRRRDISVVTVKKLCDGLDITLGQFFSTPEFDALEQEIR
jgi:DNA-binding Xre family transcriptional regulator